METSNTMLALPLGNALLSSTELLERVKGAKLPLPDLLTSLSM